jgi:hypothetical protein
MQSTFVEWIVEVTDAHLLQQWRTKLASAKESQQMDEQTAREYCATWEEYDEIVAAR